MIVCSCNVLSDSDVRECLNPGPDCPRTPAQVYECLGCSAECGGCARTIRALIADALSAAAAVSVAAGEGGRCCAAATCACALRASAESR